MLPYVKKEELETNRSESPSFYKKQEKKVNWRDRILLNRESKVIFVLIVVAVITPLLLYYYVVSRAIDQPPRDGFSFGTCLIPRSSRIPCGLGNMPRELCHPECCYDLRINYCFHRLPSRFSYISIRPWDEDINLTPRQQNEPFSGQQSIKNLRISADEISASHLTLILYDSQRIPPVSGTRLSETDYTYEITIPEVLIEVFGPSGLIFTTLRGPLMASDNIWEISLKLTNETMFGLGEIPLTNNTVKVIYSNEKRPDSIPLIYAKSNGSYHGFLIDNYTPTEVKILDNNQILIRSITLESLKFHLFTGPDPVDIMKDVKKFIGFENQLEYWMLGTHVCREVDTMEEGVENLENFLDEASRAQMLFESHCGITPIVFNTNCDLEGIELIEEATQLLENYNKKFIPHVSPYIQIINNTMESSSKERESLCPNLKDNFEYIFIKDKSKTVYVGTVDNADVIYPDYEYATEDFLKQLWPLNVNVDGVVLQNNWPLDQSIKLLNETYLELPYFSQDLENAFENTLPWNSIRGNDDNEIYMYKHNKYGNNFAKAVKNVTKNLPVLSTSQWMNGNIILNSQEVNTSWASLRAELVKASLSGISGHWFWSTPICGDMEDFDAELHTSLCVKWYMAATYFPLIKIHSKTNVRDPMAFSGIDRIQMLQALKTRLSLLPYFYTILQSGPLLRPMFYQFPYSKDLTNLTTQFSIGDDLLIVPNLLPRQSHVHVWVPPGDWYELWSGLKLEAEEGDPISMATTQADFLVLIQAGKILLLQKDDKQSLQETRRLSKFSAIIALKCDSKDEGIPIDDSDNIIDCYASGKMFLAKDSYLIIKSDKEKLTITAEGNNLDVLCDPVYGLWANKLTEINIYGLKQSLHNYDNLRRVSADINLCDLQNNEKIIFNFING